ncbi:MAG: UbiX family flavin prenyltransferase [Bacteroidales bacterium]
MKIAVGISGASGAIYAKLLVEKLCQLSSQVSELAVVFTDSGREVFAYELGKDTLTTFEKLPLKIYDNDNFYAPIASGSSSYQTMIIAPCSMGTLARIATGTADNLITRAADVMLKERRRLILLTRETPHSLIHLRNMQTVTEAGGIICPASPSFYTRPQSLEELCNTVVERVLSLADIKFDRFEWGKD